MECTRLGDVRNALCSVSRGETRRIDGDLRTFTPGALSTQKMKWPQVMSDMAS